MKLIRLKIRYDISQHSFLQKWIYFFLWFFKLDLQIKNYMICSNEAYIFLTLLLNNQNNCQWSKFKTMVGSEKPL